MANPSSTPGANGECGHQHGNATCLPMMGRTCCSINGYCGSNETYCLVSNGCQSGCVDPSEFFPMTTVSSTSLQPSGPLPTANLSSTVLSSANVSSTFFSPTVTTSPTTGVSSATSTATSIPAPTLTTAQRSGVIAGATIGGVALLAIAAYYIFRWQRRKSGKTSPATSYDMELVTDPRGGD